MECLVKWANTFEGLSKPCTSIEDFSDGVILEEILAQVAPKHFSAESIKRDFEDNWVLKVNNVKKIVSTLDRLYQMDLGIHYGLEINATAIARDQDTQEIVKLVELVLGVMVESELKNEYIGNIMILDETTQRELMVILEGIINRHQIEMSSDHSLHDSSSTNIVEDARFTELQNQYDQLTRELFEEKESHSDLKQDYEIVAEQVKTLKEERENLQRSVYALEDALKEEQEKAKNERDNYLAASLPRQASQTSLLEEERTIVWTAQIEERDKTIADLKKKMEELAKQAAESRTLRDELDILREKALSFSGLEEKLKKSQLKSEQVNDLKKQLKVLEEQNDVYLRQALDAEENARGATSLKTHLESYKQQVVSLKTEYAQLEVSAKTQQIENERMKTEISSLQLENSALKFRVDSLQAEVNDLSNAHHAHHDSDSSFETAASIGGEFMPQMKERIAVLERENQRLREKNSAEAEHRISELTHQLEDANKLNEVFKKELEKGGGGGSFAASAEVESLKDQLNKLNEENKVNLADINKLLKDKQELMSYKTDSELFTDKLKAAAEKIATLSAEKTKHEGFLRAAKSIISEQREQIKQLNEKGSEKLRKDLEDSLQTYRNQLKEKDNQIEMITKLWEEGKENSAREQRLMTSAFYDMGLELHKLRNPKTTSPTPSSSSPTPSSTPRSLLGALRQGRE